MRRWTYGIALLAFAALFLSPTLLRAQPVTYTTIDPSGSTNTNTAAIDGANMVGAYVDGSAVTHGFFFDGTNFTTLDPSGSTNTNPVAISGTNVVGYYVDGSAVTHGFFFDGTNYTTLDPLGSTATHATGVSGTNVAGYYVDGSAVTHGFFFDGTNYTTLDPPGATATKAAGISGTNVVGAYVDSSAVSHGFLFDGTNYTTLDPPGSAFTQALAISGNNVVGTYADSSNVQHGFFFDGTTYTTLDPPGTTATQATGVSGTNVVGYYADSGGVTHGFLFDGTTYTTLDPSGTIATFANGVSSNNVVGQYTDSGNVTHGFLATIKTTATVTLDGGTLAATYDGTAHAVTATTIPPGLNVTFSYTDSNNNVSSTAPTAAGSYAVVGTINDPTYAGSASGTLVIGQATATVTLDSGTLAATYDGTAHAVTATTTPLGLTVTFTYTDSGNTVSSTPPTNAGSYAVVATISDPNYSGTASGTLVIGQATATVTLDSGSLAATYDGNAHAATATTSPTGLSVTFTYTDSGNNVSSTAPTNAGSYAVVGTISDPNYTGTGPAGTLVISQAVATVAVNNLTFNFDGTPHAATATTTPPGLSVTFTYNGSSTIPSAMGSYAVVGTISDPNYTAGTGSGTLVINPGGGKTLATVTLGSLSATYNALAHKATATTVPAGLPVTFTYNGSATAPIAAGSYAVVGTVNTAAFAGNASGTLVIGKAAATVTLGSLAATYTGVAHKVTAVTKPAALIVTFTYNGSATAPTAAGSYPIIASVNNANYTGSATGTLVIAQAKATVALSGLAATYDGTAKSITVKTSPVGLGVSVTYNSSPTAPTGAGSYAVLATVTNPNYSGSATGSLVIAKAKATVTLGNLNLTYDGSAQSVTATTNPLGLTVIVTYNGSATPPTTAGTYTVVGTISDTNYLGSATGSFLIGTAAVSLGNLSAIYDGTAKAATATTVPVGLKVTLTYNGSAVVPKLAGSYAVVGTIGTAGYTGRATGTLVIGKATATVTLTPATLSPVYSGAAKAVTATTVPAGLAVTYTYNGSATAPILVGSYAVIATVNNANYQGTASGTLNIGVVPPVVTTAVATLITGISAKLNGTVNLRGSATTVYFEYGTSTGYGSTTPTQNVTAGTATVSFSASIPLPPQTVPGVIYHYRAVAVNTADPANPALQAVGLDKTFTPLLVPKLTTPQAFLGASGTEVFMSVNPNGLATSAYYEYSTTSDFSSFLTTTTQILGSGKTAINVFALFPNLLPNTTYYYRLVTTGAAGTIASDPATFTTLGFETTLIAKKGDAAADTAATFASFGNPAINFNTNDVVAFTGTLTAGAGVTAVNNVGIWADDNSGTRHMIARIGTAAPGTAGTFLTLSDPVYNSTSEVTFRGTLKVVAGQATALTAAGIWKGDSLADLTLVARQGSTAPGTSGTFNTFTSLGLSDTGGVVLYATLNATAGITAANNAGVWEGNSTSDLHLILQLGQVVDGRTVTKLTFLPTETVVNGQTRSFNSVSGDFVCGATFSDSSTAVLQVFGGTAHIAIISGVSAGFWIPGATFASYGNPILNIHDLDAFIATLTTGVGGVTASNNVAIFDDDSFEGGHMIARTGTNPLVDQAAPGTVPPATFVSFSDPVYNDNEAIAFRGMLNVAAGQATATTASGIWADNGTAGTLALIAQQGVTQAPGCPAGATFSAFTELALPDQGGANDLGGVVFLATLNANATAGVTTANNLGIWAVDNSGALQLIVRTGDILNVGEDGTPIYKTVTGISFLPALATVGGQSRSFAQGNGDLVYLATFSDGSTAILNVVF